jgi:hypothetical protein
MEVAMRVEELLESYVREVAGQLPVKMRSDVSLELASLLREDLVAKAETAGRAPDEALAVEVLKAFGPPREVAARYRPSSPLIDPSETRNFLMTVIVGSAVLVALSVPAAILTPEKNRDVGASLLWWIGIAAVIFVWRGWVRRRNPAKYAWTPGKHDPDRVSRGGMIALLVMAVLGIVSFGMPRLAFGWLFGHGPIPTSLQFDPGFRVTRLPWLFAAWIWQALMLVVLIVRGRWSVTLRRMDLFLSIAVVALLAWYTGDGPVMLLAAPNQTVKAFITMIVLLLAIDIAVKVYRGAGQLSAVKLQGALGR